MEIEKLKQKILDLAIRGKLVPQDPNDEPAFVLIDRIRAEKEELIKQGKIKRSKEDSYIYKGSDNCYYEKVGDKTTCINDEIPFEIPNNWTWTRLRNILDVRDGTHDSPKYHSNGIPFVTSKNLKNGEIDFSTCKLITQEDADSFNARSFVDDKDILFAMIGTIGNPTIVKKDREFAIKNVALFKNIDINCISEYWVKLLLEYMTPFMKKKTSSGLQPFVSLDFLRNYLVPIPPRKTQVSIIQTMLKFETIVNSIIKSASELEHSITQIKSKILEEIFGENSRYKSYYTQTQEKLENIASLITKGSTPTSYGFQYVEKGISFVKVENVHDYHIDHTTIRQFITEDAHEFQKRSQLQENDMLFSIAGTIGRICLVKNEDLPANTNQAFAIIRGYDKILIPSYLKWYLTWYLNDKSKLSGHGGGMLNITLNDLKKLEVFYPTNKNDQQAIVDRIENLMNALCRIS